MTYARGKKAWGECARSGRRMLLKDMVADGYYPDLIVDPAWRDERHPQEHLRPVRDATTLYRPAPEDLPAPTAVELEVEGAPAVEDGVMFVLGTDNLPASGTPWQVSDDGVTWRTIAEDSRARRIVWLRERQRWIAATDTGIRVSDDGENWTMTLAGDWVMVLYAPLLGTPGGEGRLLVGATNGDVYYSDDSGDTWTQVTDFNVDATPITIDEVFVGAWDQEAERFVFNGLGNTAFATLQHSTNGINFSDGDPQPFFTTDADTATDNLGRYATIQTINHTLVVSDGGVTWAGATGGTPPGTDETSIDYGLGLFMLNGVSGAQNVAQRSSNGGNGPWTSANVGLTSTLGTSRQVRSDPTRNQWWYVSDQRLHRSTDAIGSAWTEVLQGLAFSAIGVRHLIG